MELTEEGLLSAPLLIEEGDGPSELIFSDQDEFFQGVYRFFYYGGTSGVCLHEIATVVATVFSVCLSVVLCLCVDYDSLLSECHSEESCPDLTFYLHAPLRTFAGTFSDLCRLVFVLALSLYITRVIFDSIARVQNAFEVAIFFKDALGVKTAMDLDGWEWGTLCEKIVNKHNTGVYRVGYTMHLTVEEIVHRVLRKDHFFLGLMLDKELDMAIRTPPLGMGNLLGGEMRIGMVPSLEWALQFSILEFMFDDTRRLNRSFRRDEGVGLAFRFRVVGLVLLLVLPFALVYEVMHFFLSNAQYFHSNKSYLGPRVWTAWTLYRFREFNEMPDRFEARMRKSFGPANMYLASTQPPEIMKIAGLVAFMTGALVATLLLASFADEAILLYVRAGGHNLLWWLGVLTAIYAGASATLSISDKRDPLKSPYDLLEEIQEHTRTQLWSLTEGERKNRRKIRRDLDKLFVFKLKALCLDLISSVFVPIQLIVHLPSLAPKITAYLSENAVHLDGIGDVFAHSVFTRVLETQGVLEPTKQAKVKSSLESFRKAHPSWNGAAGASLLACQTSTSSDSSEGSKSKGTGLKGGIKGTADTVSAPEHSTDVCVSTVNDVVEGGGSDIPPALLEALRNEDIEFTDDPYWHRFSSAGAYPYP